MWSWQRETGCWEGHRGESSNGLPWFWAEWAIQRPDSKLFSFLPQQRGIADDRHYPSHRVARTGGGWSKVIVLALLPACVKSCQKVGRGSCFG